MHEAMVYTMAVQPGGSEVKEHPQLHSTFKSSLRGMRLCFITEQSKYEHISSGAGCGRGVVIIFHQLACVHFHRPLSKHCHLPVSG